MHWTTWYTTLVILSSNLIADEAFSAPVPKPQTVYAAACDCLGSPVKGPNLVTWQKLLVRTGLAMASDAVSRTVFFVRPTAGAEQYLSPFERFVPQNENQKDKYFFSSEKDATAFVNDLEKNHYKDGPDGEPNPNFDQDKSRRCEGVAVRQIAWFSATQPSEFPTTFFNDPLAFIASRSPYAVGRVGIDGDDETFFSLTDGTLTGCKVLKFTASQDLDYLAWEKNPTRSLISNNEYGEPSVDIIDERAPGEVFLSTTPALPNGTIEKNIVRESPTLTISTSSVEKRGL